jgi:hypothetical protein
MKRHSLRVSLAATSIAFAGAFAINLAAQAPQRSSSSAASTPSAKADLNGMWNDTNQGGIAGRGAVPTDSNGFTNREESNGSTQLFPSRRCAPNQEGCNAGTNEFNDYEFLARTDPNRPLYKPKYWDKVQNLDYNLNFENPTFRCYPAGIPAAGPPRKIIQTANEVALFHNGDYRIVPTDGRKHNPDAVPTFYGDSVGHWEGDTLVIDTVGFNDTTWLAGAGGFFHSFEMHLTERLRREGNMLHYQVTVDDPDVFLRPWVMNERVLKLNTDPKATLGERVPCRDIDADIQVSRIRH